MIELRWLRPELHDQAVFLALLSEAERDRALRFHQAQDRLSYAAAHALLRAMLSEAAGDAPRAWRFAKAPSGKPRLDLADGDVDLGFSLSHARGMVACAVAPALELGVDIEHLDHVPDALRLARTHFTTPEADALHSMAQEARSKAFLHLWTLKEAFLKATGEGIEHMGEPEFDPRTITRLQETSSTVRGRAWAFRRFFIPGSFLLALAFPLEDGLTPIRCAAAGVRAGRLHALS